ncbi:MAG: hypothetical protein MUE51_04705 [Thermoleophilia bacterium]|nr:hypothetical protein [Thermoleophilia bacterium]
MRRGSPIALLAALLAALAAVPALGATGRVTILVPPPPTARLAQALPPMVLAYPLDPGRDWAGAAAPRGRATLRLDAGPWIVVTAAYTARGQRRYRAELVEVAAGRAVTVRRQSATAGDAPSVGIGTIRLTDRSYAGSLPPAYLERMNEWATEITSLRLPPGDPCRPTVAPSAPTGRNPLWQAVQQAARRAAATGPAGVRARARAAASRLSGGRATATFSGEVSELSVGRQSGTFRLTDAQGRVVAERTVTRTGRVGDFFKAAFAEVVRDLCAPPTIQVDARVAFDAGNRDVRGSAVVTLRALGRERIGPDGRVERGNYEYATTVTWQVESQALAALPGARCAATLAGTSTGEPFGPPTALATRTTAGAFSVILGPAANMGYVFQSPCNGGDQLIAGITAIPAGITVDVPALGRRATRSGEASLGGVTGTYSADVTVTRPPDG